VLVKQSFAWMVSGTLNDEYEEFFIKIPNSASTNNNNTNDTSSSVYPLLQSLRRRLNKDSSNDAYLTPNSTTTTTGSNAVLRLDMLPSSQVSLSVAAKILFAGRATRLLNNSSSTSSIASSSSNSSGDLFTYLSKGVLYSDIPSTINANNIRSPDISDIDRACEDILRSPGDQFSALFGALCSSTCSSVSARTFLHIRDQLQLLQHLQALQSVLLLGRGELFQTLLDQLFTIYRDNATTVDSPEEASRLLDQQVLPTSLRLLGLSEDSIASSSAINTANNSGCALKLSVHSQKVDLKVSEEAVANKLVLTGTARFFYSSEDLESSSSTSSSNISVERVLVPRAIDLCAPRRESTEEIEVMDRRKALGLIDQDVNISSSTITSTSNVEYLNGAVWLKEMPGIVGTTSSSRGLMAAAHFTLPWQLLPLLGTTQVPPEGERVLGEVCISMHGDPRSSQTVGMGQSNRGVKAALCVAATFYGEHIFTFVFVLCMMYILNVVHIYDVKLVFVLTYAVLFCVHQLVWKVRLCVLLFDCPFAGTKGS
jgi:hypothetical protein